MTAQDLNFILAFGTLAGQAFVLVLLALYFFDKDRIYLRFIGRYGIVAAFLVSLVGTVLTLVYSEIFGFEPCALCWLQRAFLYPQVVILGIAFFKNDTGVSDYGIGLASFGALIALYHHYLQMGGTALVSCPVVEGAADCAKRLIFEFGYVTFPLMSFTSFALIIALLLIVKKMARMDNFSHF